MKNTSTRWNQVYKAGRKFSPVSEIVLDQLNLKGKTALEVGCGTGELARQLKSRGFDVVGIELSDVAIHQAKQTDPEITYLHGNFMDSEPGEFDVVVANKVIAFNDVEAFLSHVYKCLKPGGTFVLITPVTRSKYATKYSDHLNSISTDYDELNTSLLDKFGHSVQLIDRCYFEDYGEELTIVATK